MSPGKRPINELAMTPVIWGLMFGLGFGFYQVFAYPQVIHKPAMARYKTGIKNLNKKNSQEN